jgi:hypothetical protein
MKELQDVAIGLQTHAPIPMTVETSSIGRLPKARATGTHKRFEKPRTRIQMPILLLLSRTLRWHRKHNEQTYNLKTIWKADAPLFDIGRYPWGF